MKDAGVDSAAFKRALLQSEQRRILVVAIFVSIFIVIASVRIFVLRFPISPLALLLMLLLIAYELVVLWRVKRALRANRELPDAVFIVSTILESSLPALGIAFFTDPRLQADYRPLATPWVLAFFPFIILSTLRLNPTLCRLAGIVASAGYLISAYEHGWRPVIGRAAAASVTDAAVGMCAAILLASGLIAGAVSVEIRKHVEAALREAEVERQLERAQHDLQIARSIQQSLLPKVRPAIAGFEIAGWNRSADDTGGDYFDWKHLPDGRVVVSLADVTGHGIGPALLASVCRAYSRASFNGHGDLAGAVQRINEAMAADLTPGRFATFVAAICKAGENQVEVFSAGHGPLLVYISSTGTLQEIPPQSIPLGLMPQLVASATVSLILRPGDMLLLITDGFFEWADTSGEEFGMERVAETVRRVHLLSPEEIIAELYNAVVEFSKGTRQQDDLTAVVIKRVTVNASEKSVGSVTSSLSA